MSMNRLTIGTMNRAMAPVMTSMFMDAIVVAPSKPPFVAVSSMACVLARFVSQFRLPGAALSNTPDNDDAVKLNSAIVPKFPNVHAIGHVATPSVCRQKVRACCPQPGYMKKPRNMGSIITAIIRMNSCMIDMKTASTPTTIITNEIKT
jgi:hypothetical protein